EESSNRAGFNSGYFPLNWLYPGQTYQFTFTTPGTYKYYCVLHKGLGMVGTVAVNSGTTSPQYFFTAAPIADDKQIIVRWSVPPNKQRVGFHLLRSTGWDQEFVRVNDGVIKAESETNGNEQYQFLDTQKTASDTQYFYVLEEVRLDGQDSFIGPAIATAR